MSRYRAPICMGCKHLADQGLACAAYPDGIPLGIIQSQVDHRQPYAGDNGTTFEPKDKAAADYATALFDESTDESE